MIKHEIKIELSNTDELKELIEKAYFGLSQNGVIKGKNSLRIEESDVINYTIFNDLDGATVKVTNKEIIDGTMRFLIEQKDKEIKLIPISIYCIKEESGYIFY